MSLVSDLVSFENEQKRIKEEYKQRSAGSDCLTFGNVKVGLTSNLSLFSNGEVVFSHTALHTFQKVKDKEIISKIHGNLRSEMLNRGLVHPKVDKLDNI